MAEIVTERPDETAKLLHSFDHAAKLLDSSNRTVRRLCYRGELDLVKVGRSSRVTHSSLVAFIERRRQERTAN
jgi:excisionase family DNA binding protein